MLTPSLWAVKLTAITFPCQACRLQLTLMGFYFSHFFFFQTTQSEDLLLNSPLPPVSLEYPQTSSFQTTVWLLGTLQFTTASNVTYPQTSSFPTTQSEDLLPFNSPLPPKLQCHLPPDIILSDLSLTTCYPSVHHCLQCHLPTDIILSDHTVWLLVILQFTTASNVTMSLIHRHHLFRPHSLTTCYSSIHHCLQCHLPRHNPFRPHSLLVTLQFTTASNVTMSLTHRHHPPSCCHTGSTSLWHMLPCNWDLGNGLNIHLPCDLEEDIFRIGQKVVQNLRQKFKRLSCFITM